MLEGQVIGDYGSEQEQAEARSKDERDDWSKIPVASLHAYQSSLSFFDAKGTRFHVPAFLMAETNGERLEMDTGLTMAAYMTDKFALLNDEQRAAVHAFLLSMQPHEEYAFSSDEIGRPLQAIGPRNWLSFDLPE